MNLNIPKDLCAIILDMDGVLADTEPIHIEAFRVMLKEYNIVADEEFLISFIGHSVENNIDAINSRYFESHPLPITETAKYRDDIYLKILQGSDLKPMPGIEDFLLFCASHGIRLALASSSIREQIDVILSRLTSRSNDILSYENSFRVIVSGDMVAHKKPAGDIYQLAVQKLNFSADRCFAVEDSVAGIQSAQAAGLKCFVLKNEYNDEADIAFAHGRIDSIKEIVLALELTRLSQ